MTKLLVSACLLGQPVRYDGKSKPLLDLTWLQKLQSQNKLVVLCPEQLGGLPTPRAPAERVDDKVITVTGVDVTEQFDSGAKQALQLCKQHQIQFALLKANSPSCGNKHIYDGTYSGQLITGMGMTAELLQRNGIRVFSELELEQLKVEFSN